MDNKFEIFGIKFGLDFLLGLIPFYGNITTTFVSLFTIAYSAFYGVSIVVLIRMLLNISVDLVLTAIPILGNFADIFWKANAKNYQLLEAYERNPQSTVKRSILASLAILGSYISFIVLCFYLLYKLTVYIIALF